MKKTCLYLVIFIFIFITAVTYAQTDKTKLDEMYTKAVNSCYSANYSEALSAFKAIQDIDPDYKKSQVQRFIKVAETHLGVNDASGKVMDKSPEELKKGEGKTFDVIKFAMFDIDVITKLPEAFITQGNPPQIDAEKLYANLYSLRNQNILNVTEWELFAETGKKNILDTRTAIPGTDEKEGLYFEVTPEITKDGKIGSHIEILKTELVELKTVTAEGQKSKVVPIMSMREMSSSIEVTPDKPVVMMGSSGPSGIGIIPAEFTMILATRYLKPKASIEFRLVRNTPEAGFTQTNVPDSNEKVYISDKSELNNSDIRGVKSGLSHQGFEQIEIVFTDEGVAKLAELTERIAGERLAILVNGDIISMPVVKEKIAGSVLSMQIKEEIMKKILGE